VIVDVVVAVNVVRGARAVVARMDDAFGQFQRGTHDSPPSRVEWSGKPSVSVATL
jgi:hypothetical protein